ncbi:glycosyltransferase family 4 protein [Adhaeretor mobilis]|uniref:GDP-mannose-dependent alpha-(1-2)-phosphatidylinositol mannosyltransferase n=1 Tax=Adhaeretor mobilis TaxID=1930276 RepID=A0A517N396_9BACT|nr:glycosyltransferase family 4 protein [Adhaeretor mobilis]QDT01603.1 GDP-mannose-dependent alpha-(1-2)-phosphatidylinositol mannosyltransferase [Adhaeretor mobilis]
MAATVLHVISRLDRYGRSQPLRGIAKSQASENQPTSIVAFSADEAIVSELADAGIETHIIQRRGKWDFIAMGRLARLLSRLRPAVVHTWDATALMQAKLTMPRESRLVHSLQAAEVQLPWAVRLIHALREKFTTIVAPDETHRQWCEGQGVPGDRVVVIPPAVEVPSDLNPEPTRSLLLSRLELPTDTKLIATAGPLLRDEKLDEAIWCYELLRVLHPTARLVIIGDGPDRARLERFARLVSDPSCIYFLGERSDAKKLISTADVFWQPSLSRSTPLALLEAMATSRAVVASDLPAHQSVIEDGKTGRLAPIIDRAKFTKASHELLEDDAIRERIGSAGRDYVREHHNLQSELASYHKLYQ